MRMTTYLTSACLTLLGTIALAQSVTHDYDRAGLDALIADAGARRDVEVTPAAPVRP